MRYGMRAAAIFFFARVIRAAIVASPTRNARATCGVVSPHTSRRVRATWAGRDRAGWQQVKTSRSRSSAMSSPSSGPAPASSSASSGSAVRRKASRRIRSTARLRAAVVSQAPGRAGTPVAPAQATSALA
ncbi:hypothetical protein SAMN05216259_11828 [Actinacidiphila guanduensis]|uniref:Secreted protein n=1 Tax=Actinacidiphila guanduensis TaxID=310781 RepID=A0A1H0QBC6_9ACTN|nr:hypothetical protein SAMN05216259_11828 [Actinacidiphila guanduensis]